MRDAVSGRDDGPSSTSSALARGLSDGALLALGAGAGALFGLLSLRLLLTGLSEAEYGRYCLFHVVAGVLGVLLTWPVQAVLRLGAEEVAAAGGRARLGRTLGSVGALVLGSLLCAAAAAGLARGWIDALVGHPAWRLALLFAALTALAQLGYALLQPAGLVRHRTTLPALTRAVYAGLLGLVVLRAGGLDLERALVLCVASVVPGVVLPLVLVRPGAPRVDPDTAARAARFGAPLLLRNLGVMGVLYVDLLVIRALLGEVEAGRYDVAYRVAEQVVVFGFVLDFLAGPILADAAARGRRAALAAFYRLAAPPLVWTWSLLAALLLVLAEPALTLLGAKSAAASADVLQVLLLAVALRGGAVLEGPVFDAHLLSRRPTLYFFLGFALNLVLDVLLIAAGLGITGAAVGTVCGFLLQAVLRARYIGRVFGVAAWRPYLGILPVPALLLVDRASGGAWPLGLVCWVALTAAVLLLGRRAGLFPADGRAALAEVRMPRAARRLVDLLYGRGER